MTTASSDSDSESSDSENPLTPVTLVPSSSALADITNETFDRSSETDKWLETMVQFTLKDSPDGLERKNTIDIKRHRVFSTTVDVHPRDLQRTSSKTDKKSTEKRREVSQEEISSWIASEIYTIAKTQAEESERRLSKQPENVEKDDEMERADDNYDEIENLIGEYFEDLKVSGSNYGEDQ